MWVKGYEQETQRKKKTEVANEHPKILDLTSQGNAKFSLDTKASGVIQVKQVR